MADLTPADKLQPCLLDRLTDEAPNNQLESRTQRLVSTARFKDGVLRDIRWIFSSRRMLPQDGLSEFPEVEKSVLNFGVRDFAGMFMEGKDLVAVERAVHEALLVYEPRIVPHTLKVKMLRADEAAPQRNPHQISLEITSDLWAQPFFEKLYAKTMIDLETRQCAT